MLAQFLSSPRRWRANVSPGVDRQQVILARRLDRVPLVREQLSAGRVSARDAGLIARAVLRARPFLDRPDGPIDGQDGEAVLYGVLVDGLLTMVAGQAGGMDTEQRAADL